MAATKFVICNRALDLLSGGKDTVAISSFIDSDAREDTSLLCGRLYDPARRYTLKRFKAQETLYFADLGDDLKDTQIDISSIVVGADPFPVTVTTDTVHGKSTGDQVYLLDVAGTGGIISLSLSGTLYTITVVDTTSFTLDDVAGTANWSHTADTGVMSDGPESADWSYIFHLPSNCLHVVRQIDEGDRETEYDHAVKQGYLFTNTLSNADGDSAYIEFVEDEEDTTVFSDELEDAIVVRLASQLAPRIMGAEHGSRRREELIREFEGLVLPVNQGINRSQQYHETEPPEDEFSWLGGRTE